MSDLDRPFKVYCLRTRDAGRMVVGRFARYVEAEVFIHAELLDCGIRGTDTRRFWGSAGKDGHVHYWIESPQLTASVQTSE